MEGLSDFAVQYQMAEFITDQRLVYNSALNGLLIFTGDN